MPISNALLCQIEVSESSQKNISTQDLAKQQFYSAQILKAPRVEFSGTGFVTASFGQLVLLNRPTDRSSVFNFSENTYPPEAKVYPIKLLWGEQLILEGSAVLKEVGDEIILEILEPDIDQDLLETLEDGNLRPVAFGAVNHKNPLKISETELSNPFFDLEKPIRVFEDGVEIGSNQDGSNVFTTAPTEDVITLNSETQGDLSISGTSKYGVTLKDFFEEICTRLSLTLNDSRASSAFESVSSFITSQMSLLELADKVATSLGYQFFISEGTLFLIDKERFPYGAKVEEFADLQIDYGFPVKRFESQWQARLPFGGVNQHLGEETLSVSVLSEGLGSVEQVEVWKEDAHFQRLSLKKLLRVSQRPLISVTKPFIDLATKVGDGVSVDDPDHLLSLRLIVRGISYDFEQETTTLQGDGRVEPIRRERML